MGSSPSKKKKASSSSSSTLPQNGKIDKVLVSKPHKKDKNSKPSAYSEDFQKTSKLKNNCKFLNFSEFLNNSFEFLKSKSQGWIVYLNI